jgi:hypothetical protein
MFNNMDAYLLSIKATIDASQLRNAPCIGRTQSCRRLRHRRARRDLKPSDNLSHRDGDLDGRIKLWRRLQKQRAAVLKHFHGSCPFKPINHTTTIVKPDVRATEAAKPSFHVPVTRFHIAE